MPATLLRSTSMDWYQRVPELMELGVEQSPQAVSATEDGGELSLPVPVGIENAKQLA